MLDIIVATRDNLQMFGKCYERIIKYIDIPYEIYLADNSVDNNSIKNRFENIVNYTKCKFTSLAKLWNDCIRKGSNPYVAVINDDAFVTRNWTIIVDKLKEDIRIGLLTPLESKFINQKILNRFANDQPINEENYDQRAIEHYNKYKGLKEIYGKCEFIKNKDPQLMPLIGSFMLFRRSVFEDIGYFDEQFQFYYEDIDMFYRTNIKYFVGVIGDLLVYHIGQQTFTRSILGTPMQDSYLKFKNKWAPILEKI